MRASAGGFDAAPGTLTTDTGERIGPSLTRGAFLASSLAEGGRVLVENPPWMSWAIGRSIAGRPFGLGLYFEGERLDLVLLALDEAAFGGPTWDDWTLEGEMDRNAAHRAWLASIAPSIGEDRTFPWGRVVSTYDSKSGGSEIVLRYANIAPGTRCTPTRTAHRHWLPTSRPPSGSTRPPARSSPPSPQATGGRRPTG